jgi:putative Ca2+/H+ antiporter (TMEM165/GDT1 family)
MIEAFLASAAVVAVAEIGDKTQLLAMLLAARFRAPLPVLLGILAATLANHAVAGAIGVALGDALQGPWFRYAVALSFFAVAAWALLPDRLGDNAQTYVRAGLGAFAATLVCIFIAEIGDKTQVATVALAARYHALLAVVAGTTLGMLLANVPAVLLGERVVRLVPERAARIAAALLFALMGVLVLAGVG